MARTLRHPRSRARGRDAGQASLELLGMVPVMLMVMGVVFQLLTIGYSITQAENAARAGARAEARGDSASAAVTSATHTWLSPQTSGGGGADATVTVQVDVPLMFPGVPLNVTTITRTATFPRQP